jgi:hypothetical protein
VDQCVAKQVRYSRSPASSIIRNALTVPLGCMSPVDLDSTNKNVHPGLVDALLAADKRIVGAPAAVEDHARTTRDIVAVEPC